MGMRLDWVLDVRQVLVSPTQPLMSSVPLGHGRRRSRLTHLRPSYDRLLMAAAVQTPMLQLARHGWGHTSKVATRV